MRFTLAAALFLLAVVASTTSGLTSAMADEMAAGRIQIEYVAPKNPEHQAIYALLKERKVLEKMQAALSGFRLPRDVTLRTIGCDGVSNCWYQEIDHRPTITLCYEYLQEIWDKLPKETTEDGITRVDALAGQFFFAVAHEFGHLSFDVYEVPLFGREEDAADNFATFIMLHFREDARRLIAGAAWGYHSFIKNYKQNPTATLPLAAFSSNHGQPEERFFNLLCIAYGSDDRLYAGLVEKGYLPQSRAKDCKYEFEVLRFGFRRQIVPHIDQEKAAEILATEWLSTVPVPAPVK